MSDEDTARRICNPCREVYLELHVPEVHSEPVAVAAALSAIGTEPDCVTLPSENVSEAILPSSPLVTVIVGTRVPPAAMYCDETAWIALTESRVMVEMPQVIADAIARSVSTATLSIIFVFSGETDEA